MRALKKDVFAPAGSASISALQGDANFRPLSQPVTVHLWVHNLNLERRADPYQRGGLERAGRVVDALLAVDAEMQDEKVHWPSVLEPTLEPGRVELEVEQILWRSGQEGRRFFDASRTLRLLASLSHIHLSFRKLELSRPEFRSALRRFCRAGGRLSTAPSGYRSYRAYARADHWRPVAHCHAVTVVHRIRSLGRIKQRVMYDLWVYADASVPDQYKPEKGRPPPITRAAPAFAAWYGWEDALAYESNPCFLGEAFVGVRGPQRAEFLAAINGLSAALAYVAPFAPKRRPSLVTLRMDSSEVVRQLSHPTAGADVLLAYRRLAESLIGQIRELGIDFAVERVTERGHRPMKAVHGRSREAVRVRRRKQPWPHPPDAIPF